MLARKQDNTPGGLAAELAVAREAYETKRASVIERGTQRVQEIAALRQELHAEATAIADVLAAAE